MSRHGLEIRAAAPADAPMVAELLAHTGYPASPQIIAVRLAAVRQSSGTALLALEWGPPSGIVVLHWFPTLSSDLLTAQITTLLVNPEDRRRGIGRLLVKAGAQAARVAGCGVLETAAGQSQTDLRGFLHASGFESDGCRLIRGLRKQQ